MFLMSPASSCQNKRKIGTSLTVYDFDRQQFSIQENSGYNSSDGYEVQNLTNLTELATRGNIAEILIPDKGTKLFCDKKCELDLFFTLN